MATRIRVATMIDRNLKRALEKRAEAEGRSLSDYIYRALFAHMAALEDRDGKEGGKKG